jgi:hypothetical protein
MKDCGASMFALFAVEISRFGISAGGAWQRIENISRTSSPHALIK